MINHFKTEANLLDGIIMGETFFYIPVQQVSLKRSKSFYFFTFFTKT